MDSRKSSIPHFNSQNQQNAALICRTSTSYQSRCFYFQLPRKTNIVSSITKDLNPFHFHHTKPYKSNHHPTPIILSNNLQKKKWISEQSSKLVERSKTVHQTVFRGIVPGGFVESHTSVRRKNNYSTARWSILKAFPSRFQAGTYGSFHGLAFAIWLVARHACAAFKASFWAFESHREPRHVESSILSPSGFHVFRVSLKTASRERSKAKVKQTKREK